MGSKPHSYDEATSEENLRKANIPGRNKMIKNKVRTQKEKNPNTAIHSGLVSLSFKDKRTE